ncbi:MAG: ribonuclease Z [Mycobacterium sp.]|nr:ribonuclease Z [Mycobacterium sp.]
MIEIILTGTGSPMVDPHRAGPSTLVRAGESTFLVDCGRGVLMRAAAVGVGAANLSALLLTHLHSDHITDLGDVITTRWVTSLAPTPLPIIGPPGTDAVVRATLESLAPDISYRIAHHADITEPPAVRVEEHSEGLVWNAGQVRITVAPTDHRPVEPTIAFRITHDGASVVVAGDSVPCDTLDELAEGANALVHTAIRKDLVAQMPAQRIRDILDYHSSVEQAAATAARAGVDTLVLTHYVPPLVPGQEDQWRALAAGQFSGHVEIGDDLLRVRVGSPDPDPVSA